MIESSSHRILVVQQLNKSYASKFSRVHIACTSLSLLTMFQLSHQCSYLNLLTYKIASGQIALDQEVLWLLSETLIQQKTEHAEAESCKVLVIKYVFYSACQRSKLH